MVPKPPAPKTKVRVHEPQSGGAPEEDLGKRRTSSVDYKALAMAADQHAGIARKPAPASIATSTPVSIPSSVSVSGGGGGGGGNYVPGQPSQKKSKKQSSSLSSSSSNSVPRPKKDASLSASGGPTSKKPQRLAPVPREVYPDGPPFADPNFVYPDDLMPKRPPEIPFDPNFVEPRVLEAQKRLAEVEKELAEVVDQIALREAESISIQKHFKAKSVKARRLQLEMQKRKSGGLSASRGGGNYDFSPEDDLPRGGGSKKRSNKRADNDYYDDDEDLAASLASQRKAVRASAAGSVLGGSGGGGGSLKKSKSKSASTSHLPEFARKTLRLLDDLLKLPESFNFALPVDAIAAGVPDYYDVILHPMDLSTIRKKCFSGKYNSIEDVAQDLDLIFSNCVLFNGSDSAITADCKVLQNMWVGRLDKIRRALDGSDPGRSRSGARAAKAAPKPRVLKEMTFEEKELLVGQIGELPPDCLANVVQIVAEGNHIKGGDQEGAELELDVNEMSTATLRKLQAFVNQYRRSVGLEVAPEPPNDDDVFLAEDDVFTTGGAGGGGADGAKSSAPDTPKPKKPRQPKPRKEVVERLPKATGPKTHDELKALAVQTKENTTAALQELKDELKRMAGKVVDKDHAQADGSALAMAANEYSLDPTVLAQQLAGQDGDSDDSISSDTVSSDNEDDDAPSSKSANVHILPVGEEGADVVIENAAGWQLEEGGKASSLAGASGGFGGDGANGAAGGAGGAGVGAEDAAADAKLWEEFAGKDARQAELAKARMEHEEKLKREREAKEEELRKQEKEKRIRLEEDERRRREEKEREEEEAHRRREEERQARKREREENETPQIDLAEQQRMMTEFERGK